MTGPRVVEPLVTELTPAYRAARFSVRVDMSAMCRRARGRGPRPLPPERLAP